MARGDGDRGRARATLHQAEPQAVTFVELFFDLVFVFAVTQLTATTAEHLDAPGVGRSLVVFWLVWWAWTQFTWTLNPADTEHPLVRAWTLAAAGIALVMAASVPRAFDDQALWFALPYLAIRAIGLALQVRVGLEAAEGPSISLRWVWTSLVGLGLVLVGALVGPDARPWVWLAAIVADLLAAGVGAASDEWDLAAGHFSERHGLFVIIALGESLILAASAIAGEDRSGHLVATAGAAILVACLLWWTYFGWLKEALEEGFAASSTAERGPMARDAYSFLHFPLIGGIIAFAVAVEEVMVHPDEPASARVIAALAVGVGLFVGCSAASHRRITGTLLTARLAIAAPTLVAIVALGGLVPVWPLLAAAVGLLAIVVVEERTHRPDRSSVTFE
ncbi:MAG: low temperature requirement protein A [Acidimicrobiales bacterium]